MITYASFCSIFLFKQNPEQDLPLTSTRTEMTHTSPSIFRRFRGLFGYKQRSHLLPKSSGMSLVLFKVKPRISPW
jgi:hypothetical protein